MYACLSSLPATPSNNPDPRAKAYLLGWRNHWQAVVQLKGRWTLLDETTVEAIVNLGGFSCTASAHSMVLMLYKTDGTADLNSNATTLDLRAGNP